MLKERHRLRKTKDIEAVAKGGRGASTDKIAVKLAKNGLKSSRFAFVVGVKVSKLAVKRNRLRRLMRVAVRQHLEEIKPGYDVMIIAKKPLLDQKLAEVEQEIVGLFKKVKLL